MFYYEEFPVEEDPQLVVISQTAHPGLMIEFLCYYSTFLVLYNTSPDSPIQSPVAEATVQDPDCTSAANSHSCARSHTNGTATRSNLGFGDSPKDTWHMQTAGQGPSRDLPMSGRLLYLLSHSCCQRKAILERKERKKKLLKVSITTLKTHYKSI